LSPAKLTRLPLLLLLPLVLLAGCAHQLKPESTVQATPVPATPLAPQPTVSPEPAPPDAIADSSAAPVDTNVGSALRADERFTGTADSAGCRGGAR